MEKKTPTTKKVATKKLSKPKVAKEKKLNTPASKKLVASSQSLDAIIYSQKGVEAGTIALPAKIFGLKWNADLVHQVVVGMMSNARAGTAHTKDRSEVSGGGRKPWKQKGTGQARHGSTRSPIWVGGGTTHGPRNDKDYSKKINKKTRVKALFTVLSQKYATGNTLFVDTLTLKDIKTKDAASILSAWTKIGNFSQIDSKKKTGALIVLPESNVSVEKSFANLPGATVMKAADLNALVLMNFRHIVMVDPSSLVRFLESKVK